MAEGQSSPKKIKLDRSKVLCLFDVDGTLTPPRLLMTNEMRQVLKQVRERSVLAIVGGSNFAKQKEQLGDTILEDFDYVFSENGLVAYKGETIFHTQNFAAYLGEDRLKEFINFTLHYIADLDIPIKRGHFIEFRAGMLNVSPIGRDCSQKERIEFNEYDLKHHVREKMVEALEKKFPHFGLKYSIGGQISFDVFPKGWDKTYCLRHVKDLKFGEIHFFGDKTEVGGNDFEIFHSSEVIGHSVTGPDHTQQLLKELFDF